MSNVDSRDSRGESGVFRETAPRYPSANQGLTYDDYCRMPPGKRYELIEGGLRVVPSPSTLHQKVSGRIGKALQQWAEDRTLGEVYYAPCDVVLSEHDVVQPDILFISRERLEIIKKENVQGAPDLVVEILSPGTEEWDRAKRRLYASHGVRELWLVDPERHEIEVAVLYGGDLVTQCVCRHGSMLTSPFLEGFSLNVSRVFAG